MPFYTVSIVEKNMIQDTDTISISIVDVSVSNDVLT